MADNDNSEKLTLNKFLDGINRAITEFRGKKWFSTFYKKLEEVRKAIDSYNKAKIDKDIEVKVCAIYMHDIETNLINPIDPLELHVINDLTKLKASIKEYFDKRIRLIKNMPNKINELDAYIKRKDLDKAKESQKNKELRENIAKQIKEITEKLDKKIQKYERAITTYNGLSSSELVRKTNFDTSKIKRNIRLSLEAIQRVSNEYNEEANLTLGNNRYLYMHMDNLFATLTPKADRISN